VNRDRLPETIHVVEVKQSIATKNRNIEILSLSHYQTIERIAVMERQQARASRLADPDWEFRKSVLGKQS
jgi:hypothetical protein